MKLIVGLGNTGTQYEQTRHNIGFQIVDRLGETQWQLHDRCRAHIQKITLNEQNALLAKPTTMMNLSGNAVSRLAQYYKIAPEDIWIVYDELDLPLGRLKISSGTSNNGHNGIISIHQQLGHNRFWRFRVGVDSRDHREIPGREYVLQNFNTNDAAQLESAIAQAVSAVKAAMAQDPQAAMQVYNKSKA